MTASPSPLDICIDPEFAALILPLPANELAGLHEKLRTPVRLLTTAQPMQRFRKPPAQGRVLAEALHWSRSSQ